MLDRIIEVAKESSDYTQRVGCIALDSRGRVISTGINQKKTHPLQYRHAQHHNKEAIYLHAEIAALVKCRAQPHTIIVGRITRSGKIGLAKPCPICMGAIHEAGVRVIHYTNDDGQIETMVL